ncbi:ubiquinol-cytochrome c reductase iron-sulfur subunit [Streptomyces sp. NBC_00289]|uniref:QcrA and Rieske domain-containing protein n=1 Tax=Streptomyces sp. NBC_00289 TaxID=2975703 RepID=UPI00352D9FC7
MWCLRAARTASCALFLVVCTHAGCVVAEVADGEILCPCHGDRFAPAAERPVRGLARKLLRKVSVAEPDGVIVTR